MSLLLLAFLVSKVDWNLVARLPSSTWLVLPFAVALNLMALGVMAGRWKILLESASGTKVPYRALFSYYLVGAFYNNLLPGSIGGDVLRVKRASERHRIPLSVATRVTVIERIIGLGGILALAGVCLRWAPLPQSWQQVMQGHLTLVSTLVVASAVVLPFVAMKLLKVKLAATRSLALVVVLVVAAQLTDAAALLAFLLATGTSITPAALIFAVSASYLAAMVPISLGGLGVKEGSLATLLLLAGVPQHLAIVAPLVLTLARILTGTIGAAVDLRSNT